MSRCRPILWLPMALPIGVSTGFTSVAVANALARAGLAESVTGDIVATLFLALPVELPVAIAAVKSNRDLLAHNKENSGSIPRRPMRCARMAL